MTTLRSSILLEHTATQVWDVVRDVAHVSEWFPSMTSSTGNTERRTVVLADGSSIIEDIITLDEGLRRMQYRAVGGDLPITGHLGTVDVLEVDEHRCLVVYSTEIDPPELAAAFHAAIDDAVANLPAHLR